MDKKKMKEFMTALDSIVNEKGIDRSIVIDAMEQAMAAAYKKKGGAARCEVNPETGEIKLWSVRTVVDDENFHDKSSEIKLSEAREQVPEIEVGETIEHPVEMTDFGRVAAGTAKQVVVQRIKEAEKELTIKAFEGKQDELLVGTLSREDAKTYYVDLGRSFGLLPKDEIIPGEKLEMGSSIKAYVSKLEISNKGVFILLSRKDYGFVKRLLEIEIPEIQDGEVIIYSVAREAGSRSKIAVYSDNPNLEPVGCVIGANGSRINRVLKQLNGEKIDVILYDKDPAKFIANALSPAKDVKVIITDYKKKSAIALVNKENLSLAIGKKAQNIRLASRLTHFKKIDVMDIATVDVEELEEKYANISKETEDTNNGSEDVVENVENNEKIVEEVKDEESANA